MFTQKHTEMEMEEKLKNFLEDEIMNVNHKYSDISTELRHTWNTRGAHRVVGIIKALEIIGYKCEMDAEWDVEGYFHINGLAAKGKGILINIDANK